MMIAPEPTIRLYRFRQGWQFWKGWKSLARWLVATGTSLMRALFIVMTLELFCYTLHICQILVLIDIKAFFLITTVIPLNKAVLLGLMRRCKDQRRPHTNQKTYKSGR